MNSLSQISLSSYATGLLGKEITVADVDKDGKLIGETVGKVEGIALTGSNPYIYVNGKAYSLSQIVSMGTVPKKEEEGDGEDDTTTDHGLLRHRRSVAFKGAGPGDERKL